MNSRIDRLIDRKEVRDALPSERTIFKIVSRICIFFNRVRFEHLQIRHMYVCVCLCVHTRASVCVPVCKRKRYILYYNCCILHEVYMRQSDSDQTASSETKLIIELVPILTTAAGMMKCRLEHKTRKLNNAFALRFPHDLARINATLCVGDRP